MNGETANLIALTTYGNQYLMNPKKVSAPQLVRTNSTFQFVSWVRFAEVRGKRSVTVARDTRGWFERLKKKGVKRLYMAGIDWKDARPNLPDRISVAFAGCANNVIISKNKGTSWAWIPHENAPDAYSEKRPRIWEVVYKAYPLRTVPRRPDTDIPTAQKALRKALIDIRAYAKRTPDLSYWAGTFTRALRTLDAKRPNLTMDDMLPSGWTSTAARRLIAAADQAWVFGGMCSWNDIILKNHKNYDRVSNALYYSLMDAVVTGANEIPETPA